MSVDNLLVMQVLPTVDEAKEIIFKNLNAKESDLEIMDSWIQLDSDFNFIKFVGKIHGIITPTEFIKQQKIRFDKEDNSVWITGRFFYK